MIKIADGKPYLDQVKELIQEYTQWLGRDLSFQNLDKELADIAEKYTAPNGELLVAIDDNNVVLGMVAYYQHSESRCEMKRLYVRPKGRGHALGDRLIESIMELSLIHILRLDFLQTNYILYKYVHNELHQPFHYH